MLVLRAIDEGAEILGDEPVKRAFYYHVEKRTRMKREEIPNNLGLFHKALIGLFDQGAEILERRMAKILFEKLGLEFDFYKGWTFADYVKRAEADAAA